MTEETWLNNLGELSARYIDAVVQAATEMQKTKQQEPLRILDIATGRNDTNPDLVKRLEQEEVDYEFVTSDRSPSQLKRGYENLKKNLSEEELQKIKSVIIDSTNIRKKLKKGVIYKGNQEPEVEPLESILKDSQYQFLQTGHQGKKRKIKLKTRSFDLVIGRIPYGSIGDNFEKAVHESARILRKGGYHIIDELEVAKVNFASYRTPGALIGAFIKHVDTVKKELNKVLTLAAQISSVKYIEEIDEGQIDQVVQKGDTIKRSLLVYK